MLRTLHGNLFLISVFDIALFIAYTFLQTKPWLIEISARAAGNEIPRSWQLGQLNERAGFLVSGILTLPSASPWAKMFVGFYWIWVILNCHMNMVLHKILSCRRSTRNGCLTSRGSRATDWSASGWWRRWWRTHAGTSRPSNGRTPWWPPLGRWGTVRPARYVGRYIT